MDEYLVTAFVWNPERGENEYRVLLTTEDKWEAEERFNKTEITDDVPQVMVELVGEDYNDRLWTKDSTGTYATY